MAAATGARGGLVREKRRRHARPHPRSFLVPFLVHHGNTSTTIMHNVAVSTREDSRPLVILCVGDHDPKGLRISEDDIPKRLAEYGAVNVTVRRLALLKADAVRLKGPARPFQAQGPGHRLVSTAHRSGLRRRAGGHPLDRATRPRRAGDSRGDPGRGRVEPRDGGQPCRPRELGSLRGAVARPGYSGARVRIGPTEPGSAKKETLPGSMSIVGWPRPPRARRKRGWKTS